jgi:hypothetical protein
MKLGSPYKTFKADPSMEQEGIWLDYGDFKIRIARAGGSNVNYAKALEKQAELNKTAIRTNTIKSAQSRALMIKVYATSVLLDWEDVQDENGQTLPFTADNAEKVLTDCPDLFDDIRAQAASLALFRRELLEEAAKNS